MLALPVASRRAALVLALVPALVAAEAQARDPAPPAQGSSPSAATQHPLTAADLEGRGQLPGAAATLLDYHLGAVALSQDYLARDVVLLTRRQVIVLRVRGASVAELNANTLAALTAPPEAAGVPRRTALPRLTIPRSLRAHEPLLRLLSAGVSEQVDDIRLHPARRSELFVHVSLSYRAAARRRKIGAGKERLEEALVDALGQLFPRGGGL